MSLNYLTHEITFETGEENQRWNHGEEPLRLELRHFASCISGGKEPLVTGIDGLKALLIAEAALKSASKHRTIELREIIDERFIPSPSAGHTKFEVYTGF